MPQPSRPESPHLADEVESEYSIDLSFLDQRVGPNAPNETSTAKGTIDRNTMRENAVRSPDVIHTDDIGGPSDFTLNMEYWMRGGTRPRETGTPGARPQEPDPVPESEPREDDGLSVDDIEEQEKILQELSILDDDDSSVLSGTPRPSMLSEMRSRQPAVEESFDTPLKTRSSGGRSMSALTNLEPLPPLPESEPSDAHAKHDDRVKELERLLTSARLEIDQVREETRNETVRIQVGFQDALSAQKEEADGEISSLRKTLDALRDELRQSRSDLEQQQRSYCQRAADPLPKPPESEPSHQKLNELLAERDELIGDLRAELETTKVRLANFGAERQMEVLDLQSKLAANQKERDDMRLQIHLGQIARETLEKDNRLLSQRLGSMKETIEKADLENNETNRLLDNHDFELATLREQHRQELEAMRTKAQEAVRKARELRGREKQAKELAQTAIQTRDSELAQARERVSASELALQPTLEELRTLKVRLAETEARANDHRAKLEEALAAAERGQEEQDAINREMEKRLAAVVKARDQTWEKRVNSLVEERKNMGRLLMHEWGKNECGASTPQMYRYKYVDPPTGS